MPIELHLRIRVKRGCREQLFEFLRDAIPFYEAPGGIRMSLLEDMTDDHRFIERVLYATESDYHTDQARVAGDPEMKRYLERWRALLAEPAVVEVYRQSNLSK